MKKTYIKPSVKAITIQTIQLMVNSLPVDPNKGTGTQLSRRHRFDDYYDDDDEEDMDY